MTTLAEFISNSSCVPVFMGHPSSSCHLPSAAENKDLPGAENKREGPAPWIECSGGEEMDSGWSLEEKAGRVAGGGGGLGRGRRT